MDRETIFGELFDPLYAPLPDSETYLGRIGHGPVEKADRETLDSLVLAHQRNVPFENLDVYDARADISLGVAALYDKIVLRRRGGYCFELNAAFMALLTSLGFRCHAVSVRVVMGFDRHMPLSHRGTIVTIDGVRYFCDVGFGGPSPQSALLLDERNAQKSGNYEFIIDEGPIGTNINILVGGKKERLLTFSETPSDPVDFLALNEFQSKSDYSMFKASRVCNLVTETGAITLGGNALKIHANGETTEKTLSTEPELRAALKEHFGIEVSFALSI